MCMKVYTYSCTYGPRMAPRWPQDGPKMAQDGPKMAPRWIKMAPRWPQDGSRRPQDAPRHPKPPQDGPRWAQDDPKRPQDDPLKRQTQNTFFFVFGACKGPGPWTRQEQKTDVLFLVRPRAQKSLNSTGEVQFLDVGGYLAPK